MRNCTRRAIALSQFSTVLPKSTFIAMNGSERYETSSTRYGRQTLQAVYPALSAATAEG